MGPRKVDVGAAGAMDDGCGGACGALCFEADAEAGRTEERWAYVGSGQGTYRQASQMDYVGHGRGDFEKEKVTVSSGVRFRSICAVLLCFLLSLILGLLLYLFWPFNFFQTGADEMDPCMMGTVGAMTVMQREACCAQGNVAFCATTTKAPVIIHDKYYTNVRTQHVSHMVPVPVPGPPAKVITQKVYVKHHPFECNEGYGSWKTQWSHEHQRYCCYKFKESCVTKVQYRNHYKTITHVHHVTVPEKVVVPAPPPREINHIVKVPVHDPSDIKAMMEEMRAKSELLVTLMRRRTSDTSSFASRKGGKAFLGGGGNDAGRGLQMPDALSMPSSRLSQLGGGSDDLGANYWQQESQSQSLPAGQPFTFQVDIEKPLGRKLGVDVMLVTGPGSCGLLVGQVAPGSYVDQWNQRNQWPLKIQKGDLIVAANGINAWTSLPRMAQEFDVDVQRVCFTVQRSGAAMQSSAPRSSSSMASPAIQPGMSAMTSPALDAPVENSWWHGMSGMAPGNWVKPLGTSPVPQERPSKSGIQPVQLNVTGRSSYMQSLPAPDVPDDLVMPPGLAARAGQPATIPFEMQSKETSNKMPAKIPEMASAMPREARAAALEGNAAAAAADDAEATATAMAAAVVEDLGLHDDRQEAKSKLPPAKLLLCTLQLSDEDLTHVLQEALGRRPWLTTPVKQAMREHSATRSSTVRQQ